MNQQKEARAVPATRAPARRRGAMGFTLIEMAIVLVIIGLIVGGILVGQTLIRQRQINSIETQAVVIGQALNTFRDKYGGVPGEINFQTFFPQIVNGSGYYCLRARLAEHHQHRRF
jgi:prepilin-type N-terminal cleavage/methylation domain-containing protein